MTFRGKNGRDAAGRTLCVVRLEAPPRDERVEVIKALDGLEHIYSLGNTATGSGITIVVWRDKAAMEVGAAQQNDSRNQVQQDLGVSITTFNEL
jgi:hypothetical protein